MVPETHLLLSYAFWLGTISASSLLFGAVLSLCMRPNHTLTGTLAAFGGGALLAALSIELVAPVAQNLQLAKTASESKEARHIFIQLVMGMVAGSLLFIFLDQLVSKHGGYLRKYASTMAHMLDQQKRKAELLQRELSKLGLFQSLADEAFRDLVHVTSIHEYAEDETIFTEGQHAKALYILLQGDVELSYADNARLSIAPGTVLGEVSIVTNGPLSGKATAKTPVTMIQIKRSAIDELRQRNLEVDRELRLLAEQLLQTMKQSSQRTLLGAVSWTKAELQKLRKNTAPPSRQAIHQSYHDSEVKPLTIWVGILLDGIPESFIIGMTTYTSMMLHSQGSFTPGFLDIVPYTFIMGLFLSNFPEALSSSLNMKAIGYSKLRIVLLWGSLVVLTAVGSMLGAYIGESVTHETLALVEGIAAGAMLTMIASSMLPEAAHSGGSYTTGFATLLGFIAAILFKLLEQPL